ncbi:MULTISPECIES: T9SS type A sorting domain-containing protein [Dysgonomonas]|uniref:Secretion system C-terminal sorting domain-containing protein n=1 Tax=Dysgonomonas gadei ATCC BAA-286 TaxID=742766 RepID=F5IXL5_9BACT|nr:MULTISPECIES: T9SS type A sorting domain-containing protein [Dysgonomonas]EGK01684.1 hypothetical protein HMPREF9455_01832 [Dysgonomonas gadei ATCC BAA-286]MBF0648041.1 T9SS type A sorting domain-containing protein [Dysgonomonas sp. GY75]
MKKILLIIIYIMGISVCAYAQIRDIQGNYDVTTGSTWLYRLNFTSALKEDTKFIIRTSKYGTFTNSQDTSRIETVKKGATMYEFHVQWGGVATNDAKITTYKQGDIPANTKTLKIKITKAITDPPQQQYGSIKIDGPDYIPYGEIVQFVAYQGSEGYESWPKYDINTDLFEIINTEYTYAPVYRTYIKLKAKQNIYSKKTIKAYYHVTMNNIEYHYSGRKDVIIHPKHSIKAENLILCTSQTMVYKIEPLASVITWQSSTNMTLVSGQGTPNATFRASGNGYGTAKATVIYDGVSYQLENSQVWVGKPLTPIIRGNERLEEYQSQLAYFFDGEITGASEFEWRIEGNASMLDVSKGNVITIPSETNILPMSIRTQSIGLGRWGEFNLFLKTKNICGTTPEAFVHGRIKGGKPTPEEISDFSLSSLKTYTSDDVASANIRIYSFPTGSLVYKENKAINFDIQNTTLNAGIYILEKTDEEGNVTREKVMKIK